MNTELTQNPFPEAPPHAVAFALRLPDGSISLLGWMSMALYDSSKKIMVLNPGVEVVFAFSDGLGPISKGLAWLGLRELCRRIEACGASPELTHAVTLASDLMRAIGNRDNPPDRYARDRVFEAVHAGDAA